MQAIDSSGKSRTTSFRVFSYSPVSVTLRCETPTGGLPFLALRRAPHRLFYSVCTCRTKRSDRASGSPQTSCRCSSDSLTSSSPQRAEIPTEPGFGPVSSAGSSHNRPASAEDNEEALLLGCPPIDPFWGRGGSRSTSHHRRGLQPQASSLAASGSDCSEARAKRFLVCGMPTSR
jgi:hypothetical protein